MSSPHPRPRIPPAFALLIGILAVSTASIFIRYAQDYAPSVVIAVYRLALATLVLAPFALTRHRAELRQLSTFDLFLALLAGIFLAIHFATWISSLEFTTVASSVVLVTTTPLWVALFAPLALREPLSRPVMVGLSIALLGGMVVGLSDTCSWSRSHITCPSIQEMIKGKALLGDTLALMGAWMASGYLIIGRRLRARLSLISYIFVVYGMAALVLICIMLVTRQSAWGYPPHAFLWFALLALVPQLLGHSTFNWALRYLPAAYVAITLLGEPVGSTILAYILLEETPTYLKVIGAILILAGILVASLDGTKPGHKANP